MKYLLLITSLFLSSCFSSRAGNTKGAITGNFISGSYRCNYLAPSEFGLGVDLYDCVANGVRYQKVISATNVFVQ